MRYPAALGGAPAVPPAEAAGSIQDLIRPTHPDISTVAAETSVADARLMPVTEGGSSGSQAEEVAQPQIYDIYTCL